MTTLVRIELRCPVGPQRLLAIVRQQGTTPHVVDGNLIEFVCHDCKRIRRKDGDPVVRVFHRYNLAGELIESEAEY